jgi:DNA-nicking Smr family endonuclease
MANKGRNIDGDELSLWGRFVEGIRPMKKVVTSQQETHSHKKTSAPRKRSSSTTAAPPHSPTVRTQQNLDKSTLKKLKSGKMDIEGRIDLHGQNQDQAYHALKGFLTSAFAQQKRCVLVITGKGGRYKQDDVYSSIPDGQGVLKSRLPDWLSASPLNDIVLRHEPAQQKHGGGGAFYIYLKNNRTP